MRVRRLSSIGLFALVVLTSSLTTLAQYRDSLGQPWSNPVSATMSTMIWTEINKMTMYGPANRRSSGTSRRNTTTTESKPEVVPAYRLYPPVEFPYSEEVRTQILTLTKSFIASKKKGGEKPQT